MANGEVKRRRDAAYRKGFEHGAAAQIPKDVFAVTDSGNSITLHFSEIKSARSFRDSFPAKTVWTLPPTKENENG
jgi:hypothetical protein